MWQRIKHAAGTARKHLALFIAGIALAALFIRCAMAKNGKRKAHDQLWKHRAGSIAENAKKSEQAKLRMVKHQTASKNAAAKIEVRLDEIAALDPDNANLLDAYDSRRLFKPTDDTAAGAGGSG